jgi:pimeloyl-ACP methyl ester carboxylesterase
VDLGGGSLAVKEFQAIDKIDLINPDNRAGIVEIRQRNPEAKIAIFHGAKDEVIPVRMGRELAQNFPFIDFFPVEDANHVSVLFEAHDKIIRWMNN